MKQLKIIQDLNMGSDPEFFFRKDGNVIGSEKVIPENGLHHMRGYGKIVRDGVQAELNPHATMCRQTACTNIQQVFSVLAGTLKQKKNNGVTIDISRVVDVSKQEMDTLSKKSKTFGCAASMNANIKKIDKISNITVDPTVYLKRSAGGHLHLGYPKPYSEEDFDREIHVYDNTSAKIQQARWVQGYDRARNPEIIIPLLDIIVGNTCVLLDRDEGNIERRKVYGKAGEYRTPAHGIEYRTPSNFWLQSPHLASMVYGLARQAVEMAVQSDDDNNYLKELKKLVSMADIEKAINNNDFDLAMYNWEQIENFMVSVTPNDGFYPIIGENLPQFKHVVETGIDKWFSKDIKKEWIDNPYLRFGFNWWLLYEVKHAMNNK